MNVKRVAVMLWIVLCVAGVALAQTEWVQHPDNPIIGLGEPGEWDDGGRADPSVLFDGAVYHMWFAGYDVSLSGGFGHATSVDGVEWTMDVNNPVLTYGDPGDWDEVMWNHLAVFYDGSQFHMWYGGQDADGTIRGGYATSPDGSTWTKYPGNPVLESGSPGSWDAGHTVPSTAIIDGETFKLWYSGWGGTPAQIGYAESLDGIEWTKLPTPVLELDRYPGGRESGVALPSVVFDRSVYHMWYQAWDPSLGEWGDVRIGYAFSTDGTRWTKHRYNPVLSVDGEDVYALSVVFDGSTWHGWYAPWDGEVGGSGAGIYYATSDCCPSPPGLTHTQFIPAAAVASGAEGAFYQTDVDLSNRGSQAAEYQLMWLPRGEDNGDPMTSETFSLGAGMSVRYANVLSEVFDLEPDSFGALALLSTSPDLLSMSRIYTTASGEPAGTYGQSMPAIEPDDFIMYGERKRILFGTENADMRTNVGCQSGIAGNSMVGYELFDMEGNSLDTGRLILHGWGNDQINRIFEDFAPVSGYVEVWTLLPTASFYCYGSVLDNVTSDPTTILPQ